MTFEEKEINVAIAVAIGDQYLPEPPDYINDESAECFLLDGS